MATVTEAVKETLVGTTIEPELSQEIRATFDRNSRQDEASKEAYMTEEEFVNAIAPVNEDYVSSPSASSRVGAKYSSKCSTKLVEISMLSSSTLQIDERLGV